MLSGNVFFVLLSVEAYSGTKQADVNKYCVLILNFGSAL